LKQVGYDPTHLEETPLGEWERKGTEIQKIRNRNAREQDSSQGTRKKTPPKRPSGSFLAFRKAARRVRKFGGDFDGKNVIKTYEGGNDHLGHG